MPPDMDFYITDPAVCPSVDNSGVLDMEAFTILPSVPPPFLGFSGFFPWELVSEAELMVTTDPL